MRGILTTEYTSSLHSFESLLSLEALTEVLVVEWAIQSKPSFHQHIVFKRTRTFFPHTQFLSVSHHHHHHSYTTNGVHLTGIQFLHILARFFININITKSQSIPHMKRPFPTYLDQSSKYPS